MKKDLRKIIEEEVSKIKHKDVGTCLRYKGKQLIFRSKFKTSTDAQEHLDMLNRLRVINPAYEVYKCPICHLWHFGLKEWVNK